MKLSLSSFSLFTLDTYSIFDMDSGYSSHIYDLEEDGLTEDDVDFSFDSRWYLEALAENQETFLNENCIDDIIKSYSFIENSISRPAYYNYTTDSASYTVDFDARKLNKFIKENQENFLERCNNKSYYIASPLENYDEKLEFYFETTFSKLNDEYIMNQFENVSDYDFISYTIKEKTL